MKLFLSTYIAKLKRQIKKHVAPKGHACSIEARVFPRNARRSALAADIEAANVLDHKKPM